MVILGLGSNVGDRLANLRKALQAIKKIPAMQVKQISPVYLSDALLPENAPADWDMPHLNLAIRCEIQIEPLDLLAQLKNIEWQIGRKPEARHWGPRILDIDILAWDDLIIKSDVLTVPHENLQERPFALWPLADVAPFWTFPLPGPNQGKTAAEIAEKWGSRFTGDAPLRTRQIYQRIDTPQIVGILNVTPDSFSDGGKFLQIEKAMAHALDLVKSGAEFIDLGAESTAPGALQLSPDLEWQRLEPILTTIKAARDQFLIAPKISVDTRHAEVAKKALEYGVDWINDVTGLKDPAMREIVLASKVDCVMMHHISLPVSREHIIPRNLDAAKVVYEWGARQLDELERLGLHREKIIFDPGIGFGKTAEQSLMLIKNSEIFKKLETRLLVGHSRKTFLSLLTAHAFKDRDIETATMALALAKKPVDYLRIHNIELCARSFRTEAALI